MLTMKTTAQYLSKKNVSLRSILTSKIKSAVKRYRKIRFWLNQGLKRISDSKKTLVNGKTRVNDIFRGIDENRDLLVEQLNAGQDLYPKCDTSIWFRNCTHEIPSPIQGIVEGIYKIGNGEFNSYNTI